MMAGRRSRVVIAVATCLLSVPLTVWVVSRSDGCAAGEARPPGGTPPLALPTDTHSEDAAAVPDSPEDEGASPQGVHVAQAAAPPSSLRAVVPAGQPPAKPSGTHNVAPPRGRIAVELKTRAR